jgi:hypothetical protein
VGPCGDVLCCTVLCCADKKRGRDTISDQKPGWLFGGIDGIHGLSSRTHRLKDGLTKEKVR